MSKRKPSPPDEAPQELRVFYAAGKHHAEILIRDAKGRPVYSVKGEPDVLEKNYAELLAIVRLAKTMEHAMIVGATLDVDSVVSLVPALEKILCRKS